MTTMSVMVDGVIVIVAKCPIKGKSKTRLIPLLGEDGSVDLAAAMLSDVLLTIDRCVRVVRTNHRTSSRFKFGCG
jgi:glycosyltransferase A (GT-A) superfamily protein (DUF2064 family)